MLIRPDGGRKDEIVDAEFEEIGEAPHVQKPKAHGGRSVLRALGHAVIIGIGLIIILSISISDEPEQGDANQNFAQESDTQTWPTSDSAALSDNSEQVDDQAPTFAPPTTRDLIEQGKAEACAQQDVRDLIISLIRQENAPEGDTLPRISRAAARSLHIDVDTIVLVSRDESVDALLCRANVHFHVESLKLNAALYDRTFPLAYSLWPSAENEGYVLNADLDELRDSAHNAITSMAAMMMAAEPVVGQNVGVQSDASGTEN